MQIFLEGVERSPASSIRGATTTPEGNRGGRIDTLRREVRIRQAETLIFSKMFLEGGIEQDSPDSAAYYLMWYPEVRDQAIMEVDATRASTDNAQKANGSKWVRPSNSSITRPDRSSA